LTKICPSYVSFSERVTHLWTVLVNK